MRLGAWMGGPGGLLALALGVGAGAGLGAVAFRYLIEGFTYVFTGHSSYGVDGRVANPLVPGLGVWFVAFVPVVGGLLYGPLVERYASEARGHGVPEVMLAVARRGGRIRPVVAVVKSLSSALCIGSGGSVGREGPIVQIGSALGSTIGQITRAPEARMRLLVACGAAGGISATFNAPIAGVFFALEVILRDFETRSFSAVVVASVTADVIGRAAFGSEAFLQLPQVGVGSVAGYPLYLVLGLLAAAVGVFFIRFLYELEDRADRLWRFSESWRPAAGGVLLGLLLLAVPQMYGVGYAVLESAIAGNYALLFLLGLLGAKVLATSLTLSIGGSGGVFAPSLFMGAMLGMAFGLAAHEVLPGIAGPAGAYGLIGMGAVFAAAARAPMTAILIIFELTGDYRIMLPLMLAVVIATAVASRMSPDSIYTLKLARRGIDLLRRRPASPMEAVTVAEAMRPTPEPVPAAAPLAEVLDRLSATDEPALPVVDESGAFLGVLLDDELEQALGDEDEESDAGSLARQLPTLTQTETLAEATATLVKTDSAGLAVLDEKGERVVGWLSHRDILRVYDQRMKLERARRGGAPPRPRAPAPA
ncbi:MAG TPA: chloride channel protein [Solirubrobacterales bacterium]|nr:chloride channel protein [Solirubrobacterales bacterium]